MGAHVASVARIVAFSVLLAGCGLGGSPAKEPLKPGEPIPVTYYPTPTSLASVAQPVAEAKVAAADAPTEAPSAAGAAPTETPEAALFSAAVTDTPSPAAQPAATDTPLPAATVAPIAAQVAVASAGCPATSSAQFDLIPIDGAVYKNNKITDQNADLRLSVIGFAPSDAPAQLMDYTGGSDANAPRFTGVYEPPRTPAIVRTYKRRDWNWDENAAPPYGTPGGPNNDWPASVIDLATTPGEAIYPPTRNAEIYSGGIVGMVLFAAEQEITIGYSRQDTVGGGYVVHLMNFCVDPNLVALYRAQLTDGKRATNNLPGVRSRQVIGSAAADAITVAVRDRGPFLDPRSRKDWW